MCPSVCPSVRPSGNALIAKTVAISKVKASCAKHSLGRGAPLAPRMPSISNLRTQILKPMMIKNPGFKGFDLFNLFKKIYAEKNWRYANQQERNWRKANEEEENCKISIKEKKN